MARWGMPVLLTFAACGGGGPVEPKLVVAPLPEAALPVEAPAPAEAVPAAPAAPEVRRLTVGSGVRVRGSASADGPEVALLGVGTLLLELERGSQPVTVGGATDVWVRVRLPDGAEGWIFGAFAPVVAPGEELSALLTIARDRATDRQVPFAELADLIEAIDRAVPDDGSDTREAPMRLRLARELALANLASRMADPNPRAPNEVALLRRHRADLVYHEMAGQWMARHERLDRLASQAGTTPWGDDIAFAAADALRGGECEGEPVCVLASLHDTWGDYLAAFPAGRHVGDALAAVSQQLAYLPPDPVDADARKRLLDEVAWFRKTLGRVDHPAVAKVRAGLDQAASLAR